jgi:hypothetical protein
LAASEILRLAAADILRRPLRFGAALFERAPWIPRSIPIASSIFFASRSSSWMADSTPVDGIASPDEIVYIVETTRSLRLLQGALRPVHRMKSNCGATFADGYSSSVWHTICTNEP